MLQFTSDEILRLQQKSKEEEWFIPWLKKEVNIIIENEVKIPKMALATWSLYYFCPKHSVRLTFDYTNNSSHKCPIDGEILTGEPYDGAWWVYTNEMNSKFCYYLAILWMLTREEIYLEKAKWILLEYSKYYPEYEVHGNIPHNKPGKAFSQTMSDAQWIRPLAMAYDILRDELDNKEKDLIDKRLMLTCADFLMKNRIDQTHNHEVLISISVAMIGAILQRKDMLDFAVNNKYGIKYQIETAFLEDGFWFEGSMHYQIYVLEMLTYYGKFFKNSEFSLIENINFKKMFEFPLNIIQPDGEFPRLNDDLLRYKLSDLPAIYEFANSIYSDSKYVWLLEQCYKNMPRANIDSFLYGVDKLLQIEKFELQNYHNENGSGLTVFRGKYDKYLLLKHAPFGGEHDHYDRLGMSFMAFNEKISVDFGTTGYGANMHYDYYKNTGTHNTVVINEENHPPANPKVIKYIEEDNYSMLDIKVKWSGVETTPDCHTRVEWDEDSYEGVSMRRVIFWCEDYFIEVFHVEGVKNKSIDWVFHVDGELKAPENIVKLSSDFSVKKPFKYLKDIRTTKGINKHISIWKIKEIDFKVYSFCNNNNQLFYGKGPDNPSVKDVSYFINRVVGNFATFINVFEITGKEKKSIDDLYITLQDQNIEIKVLCEKNLQKYSINLNNN